MFIEAEFLLDGLLLALCGFGLLGRSRGRLDIVFPMICAAICFASRTGLSASNNPLDYLMLPADNILILLFLFIAVLLINSLWFQVKEGHILWGTAAQFALYLLLRCSCFAGLEGLGLGDPFWAVLGSRFLSILAWLVLMETGLVRWLREQLADGDTIVRIISCNTLFVLLLLWAAYVQHVFSDSLWLPAVISLLSFLILADGSVLLWEQRHIQNQQHGRMLEQYLPMVVELVESVRARQHEFNNQMMAVSAAVNTADTLNEARKAVASLTGRAGLDVTDRELLKCDSKVMSGMLFGKIKQAEFRHIRVDVAISGAFLHRSLSEADWVELTGILLDNALEASVPDDVIFVPAEDENGALRLTVSNPSRPMSSVELTTLFKRGWSTKAGGGRGYGLFNVRKLAERHGGKIIIRNERMCDRNYLTIGALVP
mgnify:FL=1